MGSGGIQLMATYIQLRNGVGYAVVRTQGEPDHSVTPDHTTALVCACSDENPEQFLKKKYNFETKTWSEAPVLRYAEINSNGEIIEIKHTVFEHEIDEDTKLMETDTPPHAKWVDGKWEVPLTAEEINARFLAQQKAERDKLIAEGKIIVISEGELGNEIEKGSNS